MFYFHFRHPETNKKSRHLNGTIATLWCSTKKTQATHTVEIRNRIRKYCYKSIRVCFTVNATRDRAYTGKLYGGAWFSPSQTSVSVPIRRFVIPQGCWFCHQTRDERGFVPKRLWPAGKRLSRVYFYLFFFSGITRKRRRLFPTRFPWTLESVSNDSCSLWEHRFYGSLQ